MKKIRVRFSEHKQNFHNINYFDKEQNLLEEYLVSTGIQCTLRVLTHQVKNSSQNFIHCLNLFRFETNYFHGICYDFELCSIIDGGLDMNIKILGHRHYTQALIIKQKCSTKSLDAFVISHFEGSIKINLW